MDSQSDKSWTSKVSDEKEDDDHLKEDLCSHTSDIEQSAGKDLAKTVEEDAEDEKTRQIVGKEHEDYVRDTSPAPIKKNESKDPQRNPRIDETEPEQKIDNQIRADDNNRAKVESTEKDKTPIKEKVGKKEEQLEKGSNEEKQENTQNVTKVNSSGWGDQPIKRLIEPTQTGWVLKQ